MPEVSATPPPNRIPVAVVTGYLGSGKTTMINHLVKQPRMDATALIINEFGEIGLDNLLIESAIENTLILENGCICCSIRGDLIDTIGDLFAKAQRQQIPPFSRILIETTGLADPGPIVTSLQSEIAIADRCHLDRVITLIDGVQGEAQAAQHEEAVIQIAQADIGLISKGDLSSGEAIRLLKERLRQINPALTVETIEHGRVDPDFLFHGAAEHAAPEHPSKHEHRHDGAFRHGDVSTWSYMHEAPLDEERLRAWLSMVFSLRPFALLRMKGLVRLSKAERPLLLQAVGNVISPPQWLDHWPNGKPENQLAFIFKGLPVDAMKRSFHRHVVGPDC